MGTRTEEGFLLNNGLLAVEKNASACKNYRIRI